VKRPGDVTAAWSQVLELVSGGMAVSNACKKAGISRGAFYARVRSSPELEREFATALADRGEVLADEIITLADERPPAGLDAPGMSAWTQRQRLRVDARKWSAAKLKPKRYGDAISLESRHLFEFDIRALLALREGRLQSLGAAQTDRSQHLIIEHEPAERLPPPAIECAHDPDLSTTPEGEQP
jgi:hypothetical protein